MSQPVFLTNHRSLYSMWHQIQ